MAAICAGIDPDLATATTKQIQGEIAAGHAVVAAWEPTNQPSWPLSADDINLALDHAGDLAQLLQEAERETRDRLYRTLDLVLTEPRPSRRPSDPGRSVTAMWWRGQD